MTLDERLDAARDEYRRLGAGAGAVLEPGPAARPPARSAPWVLSVAAVVVLVVVVALLAWRRTDRPDPPVSVDEAPTVTVPLPDTPPANRDTAPLEPDPAVQLSPSGRFTDGQEVELSVPVGFVADWSNEWPVLCATVATDQGPSTSCDHVQQLNALPGYSGVVNGVAVGSDRDSRRLRLPRLVFTPFGYRDCADADVQCHVVVRRGSDGAAVATEELVFEGEVGDGAPRLAVAPGSVPGRLVVTAPEVEEPADGESAPVGSEGWLVGVCSFGDGVPVDGPEGVVWQSVATGYSGRPGLGWNCDSLARPNTVETPLASGASIEVDVTRELYGYTGWSDCRTQACHVVLTPLASVAGSLLPVESRVVAAPLPVEPGLALVPRPSLTIVEPGPYSQDQRITVEAASLPDSYASFIGFCRVDAPWQCSYVTPSFGAGSGPRTFPLVGSLADCGLDRCFLSLQSPGEGLPPPAWVSLPADAASSEAPPG